MSKTEELKELVSKLYRTHHLEKGEYVSLIENRDAVRDYLFELSGSVREKYYGKDVYIRGLIEFTDAAKRLLLQHGAVTSRQSATGSARSRYCCKQLRAWLQNVCTGAGKDPSVQRCIYDMRYCLFDKA